MEKVFAGIRILNAALDFDREYTYFIPQNLRDKIERGSICAVPYGNSNHLRTGVVTSFYDKCDYPQIKPVAEVLNYPVTLNDELLGLCSFMADRYFCTFGTAARTILPAGQEMETEIFYEASPYDMSTLNEKGEFVCKFLLSRGKTSLGVLTEEFGEEVLLLLNSLEKLGAVVKTAEAKEKINEKLTLLYRLADTEEGQNAVENIEGLRSEKQRKIVDFLKDGGVISVSEGKELFGAGQAVFTTLVKNKILEKITAREERNYITPSKDIEYYDSPLSPSQREAFSKIQSLMESGEPKAALLYGVTGSGKTRVIIEACRKAISQGKSAIVLVPEIGLTAQAVSVFKSSFGENLAVIHSMLSVGEKLDAVRKIKEGRVKVIIGTRSAIFVPVQNLGLVVIDEEQEHTYKSENTPKYHARDIARYRCAYNKCLMLLASATPSIESFYKAQAGTYTLIRLEERYGNATLPECSLIDIKGDKRIENGKIISQPLKEAIENTIKDGRQVILFINRRGYNTHLSCLKCGYVYTCPNCSVSLTFHAYGDSGIAGSKKNKLVCHYCGYILNKPEKCDNCQSQHIGHYGFGTQKLQEELEEDFPGVECVRMDADTTGEKHSHEEIISAFREGKYQILFGTQMVAKGLDFPKVGLVGVVLADSSLYQNDFRAGERAFSLFTQIAGRSGRGDKKGIALFQTFSPDNEILKLSLTQDYDKFYKSEIALRKAVLFPPFCDIGVFSFSAATEYDANAASEGASGLIGKIHTDKYPSVPIIKFGPYREGIYRLRNKYRQRIIIKYKDQAQARKFLLECIKTISKKVPKTVKAEVDVNPPII
jgi:primosomal protein N' (replication factor Y)